METDKAGKMRVWATYRYDAPTIIPKFRFDPKTGLGNVISERIDFAEAECPKMDVGFWVATSRPSG